MIATPPSGRLRGGPLVRRALPLLWRVTRGMTLGARTVVFDRGRVLLVRHGYWGGWHFPGGGVEPGETLLAAAGRELLEETGCRLASEATLHGIFFNPKVGGRDHVAVFVAHSFEQGEKPKPNREIAEAAFFACDGLPEGTSGPTRRRLAEIAARTPIDAFW